MARESKYPGWRHMTAAQRYNARMDRMFEDAKPGGRAPAHWGNVAPYNPAGAKATTETKPADE